MLTCAWENEAEAGNTACIALWLPPSVQEDSDLQSR